MHMSESRCESRQDFTLDKRRSGPLIYVSLGVARYPWIKCIRRVVAVKLPEQER